MKKIGPLVALLIVLGISLCYATTSGSMSLKDFAVPKSLGKVSERFVGDSSHWVIQIQDIHAHYTAQQNISAIVNHLHDIYGINRLGIEGGWSTSSFPESWSLPSSREKQMLLSALLEDEHITGPAYAAIFSSSPLTLVGIEDPELYEFNRQLYLKHLSNQNKVKSKLQFLGKELTEKKQAIFNLDLLNFDRALTKFREGTATESFLPDVLSHALDQSVNTSELDQIILFEKILSMEKEIDKTKLKAEAKRLMQNFKNTKLSFEEVLRSGKVADEKLAYYTQTRAYLDVLLLQDGISHQLFFEEMGVLIDKIREKLFVTEEERVLSSEFDNYDLAKKIILLRATPDDLKIFFQNQDQILLEMELQELRKPLELGLKFYDTAIRRDKVFFDKITNEEKFSDNLAVVTGGFHTDGLSRLLREANISYIVITPEIGKETIDEKLYYKRLQDNIINAQTLSSAQNRFLTSKFDQSIPEGVNVLSEHRNIRKAVEAVVSAYTKGASALAQHSANSENNFDMELFLESSPDDQKQQLLAHAEAHANPNEVFVVSASDLETLYAESVITEEIWQRIRDTREISTVIIYESSPVDIPTWALVSGKGKTRNIQGSSTIDGIKSPQFGRLYKKHAANGQVTAILTDPSLLKENIIGLPVKPTSLVIYLLGLYEFAQNPEAFATLTELLSDVSFMRQIASAA